MNVSSSAEQHTQRRYPKDNYLQNLTAIAVNQLVLPMGVTLPVGVAIQDKFVKEASKIPEIGNYINAALKESGLDKTGIKIKKYDILPNKPNYLQKIISLTNAVVGAKLGRNAGYSPLTNSIIIPDGKMQSSVFHEMGHAMNYKFSKALKYLQLSRFPLKQVSLPIVLAGICTSIKEPAEDGKLSTGDKVKNFIHNNAGKLVFATTIPALLEEAIATKKGNKIAKKILPEEMFKSVKNSNKYGFLTYAFSAVLAGLSTTLAVKLKDYMVAQKHRRMDLKASEC